MNRCLALVALALLGAVTLPACAATTPSRTPSGATAPASTSVPASTGAPSPSPLVDTAWRLDSLDGKPLVPDTQVTLNFEAVTAYGSDGCNQYSGSYQVDGEKIIFTGGLATSTMSCLVPIMVQATAYMSALQRASTFAVAGERLTLSDAGGAALATFVEQSRTLAGTSWTVIAFNNGEGAIVSALAGTTLSVDFAADGSLSGSAGCNSYTSTYEVAALTISIGPAAATRMSCSEPAGVMEQEAQFLQALATAATYRIDGDQLKLNTADGALAVGGTRAAPPPDAAAADTPGKDPQNATYLIEGQPVTLVNGAAEQPSAPGSASSAATRYFGNAVELDLNGDGRVDSGLLLVQDAGGSGTFYYVAAALDTGSGYVGTNAILLGDRIAPQATSVDPNNPAQFIVSYGERPADAPMSAEATQMVSRTFRVEGDTLVEAEVSPTPSP
jgi:heat shock protein HslJ